MATSIRKIIDEHADHIVECWEVEARESLAAQGLTRPELVNRLPAFLASLLRSDDASADPNLVSQRWLIDSRSGFDRLRQGFELPEMVEEFHILGRVAPQATWSGREEAERPAHAEIKRLHEEIRRATSAAMALFGENLIQYQQAEKRFLRRLHKVAADSIGDDAIVPLRLRLQKKLEVISDALNAETTGLYFYEPEGQQLRLVAFTGVDGDLRDQYVTPLGAPSFASRLVDTRGVLYVADVAKSGLEVPEPRRKAGAGVDPGNAAFLAACCSVPSGVGVSRGPARYEPREVRLFESLGEGLGLLLHDERMQGDLQEDQSPTPNGAGSARALRQQVLGARSAGVRWRRRRWGCSFLHNHPELLSERISVSAQIVQDLDRTDRMVRDLLDVHQIRTGHGLTLRLGKTDLVAVARDVVQELTRIHGDRFSMRASAHEWGFWSAPEMRRAIWNLAANAIKYGDERTSVAVQVTSSAGFVELTVHNHGPVIPAEDRAICSSNPFRAPSRTMRRRSVGGGSASRWSKAASKHMAAWWRSRASWTRERPSRSDFHPTRARSSRARTSLSLA